MKASKHFSIIAIIAIIAIAVIACKEDEPTTTEQPKKQTAPLSNLFGINGCNSTVTGYLTDTQWNGVASKVETALNGAWTTATGPAKGRFGNVFGLNYDVKIIIEVTSNYKCKTSADGKTMTLAFSMLDNDLQGSVYNAVMKMAAPEAGIGCIGNCEQTYGTTAHLGIGETCQCPVPKPCGCTEQTATLDTIPIYKEAGITVKEMNDTVTKITGVYNSGAFSGSEQTKIKAKATEIRITSGSSASFSNGIMSVGFDAIPLTIEDCFYDDVIGN